jgi:MerR family transcriptional regulator/heat shock protein HspR
MANRVGIQERADEAPMFRLRLPRNVDNRTNAERRGGADMKQRRHYTISVAAELVSVHQQTIRHYERLGLIEPYRGKGDIRYFSPDDIDKLLQIRRLVDELGVNLAGVEVILNMRDQLHAAQDELVNQMAEMRDHYEAEIARLKEVIRRMQEHR